MGLCSPLGPLPLPSSTPVSPSRGEMPRGFPDPFQAGCALLGPSPGFSDFRALSPKTQGDSRLSDRSILVLCEQGPQCYKAISA